MRKRALVPLCYRLLRGLSLAAAGAVVRWGGVAAAPGEYSHAVLFILAAAAAEVQQLECSSQSAAAAEVQQQPECSSS